MLRVHCLTDRQAGEIRCLSVCLSLCLYASLGGARMPFGSFYSRRIYNHQNANHFDTTAIFRSRRIKAGLGLHRIRVMDRRVWFSFWWDVVINAPLCVCGRIAADQAEPRVGRGSLRVCRWEQRRYCLLVRRRSLRTRYDTVIQCLLPYQVVPLPLRTQYTKLYNFCKKFFFESRPMWIYVKGSKFMSVRCKLCCIRIPVIYCTTSID